MSTSIRLMSSLAVPSFQGQFRPSLTPVRPIARLTVAVGLALDGSRLAIVGHQCVGPDRSPTSCKN
jgi:hypothetical protein